MTTSPPNWFDFAEKLKQNSEFFGDMSKKRQFTTAMRKAALEAEIALLKLSTLIHHDMVEKLPMPECKMELPAPPKLIV